MQKDFELMQSPTSVNPGAVEPVFFILVCVLLSLVKRTVLIDNQQYYNEADFD